MGKDNFKNLTASSPSFGGHYYAINGTYIGHIDDFSDNDSVNVLTPVPITQSLIINPGSSNLDNISTIKNIIKDGFTLRRIDLSPTKFSNDLLLDRCGWIFGEGMGCFPKHYAFAIQNGFLTNNRNENKLYFFLMRAKDSNGKVQLISKESYMEKMGGARIFNRTRNTPLSRNGEELAVVAAVLESILEPANDPTQGSNQWLGSPERIKGHHIQGFCKHRWHSFHRLIGNNTLQPEDITKSNFW